MRDSAKEGQCRIEPDPPSQFEWKNFFRRSYYFLSSNLLYALAIQLFYYKNGIAAGGFAGIATALGGVVPLSLGMLVFLMSLPFVIWAVFLYGWRYSCNTVLAAAVYGIFVDLLSGISCVTQNLVIAALFGGAMYALGAVAMFRAEASAGGTDLVAKIVLYYFPSFSLGRLYLLVDGFCVVLAMVMFQNIEAGLVAILAVGSYSFFTDKILAGFETACLCYVVTQQAPEKISQAVSMALHRGVTCQKGMGMYHKEESNILMVVVKPREVEKLKRIAKKLDPCAFLVIAPAKEVMGGGFHSKNGCY